MKSVKSEIIINVLKHHFPLVPDSKLVKLAEKLQGGKNQHRGKVLPWIEKEK